MKISASEIIMINKEVNPSRLFVCSLFSHVKIDIKEEISDSGMKNIVKKCQRVKERKDSAPFWLREISVGSGQKIRTLRHAIAESRVTNQKFAK